MLDLTLLEGTFAVCRLDPSSDVPAWARGGPFVSITRTSDELSIVCPESAAPGSVRREGGWKALRLEGPFDFSAVGIVSSLASPLADAGISLFVISTFDTDYLLVKQDKLAAACQALSDKGFAICRGPAAGSEDERR